jgi:hypothetical protein
MGRFCGKRRSDVERQRTSTNAPLSDRTYTRTYTRQTPPADIADGSASRPACLRGHELRIDDNVRPGASWSRRATASCAGRPVQAYTDGTSRRAEPDREDRKERCVGGHEQREFDDQIARALASAGVAIARSILSARTVGLWASGGWDALLHHREADSLTAAGGSGFPWGRRRSHAPIVPPRPDIQPATTIPYTRHDRKTVTTFGRANAKGDRVFQSDSGR